MYSVFQTGRVSAVTVVESFVVPPDDGRYAARLLGWAEKVVLSAKINLEIKGQEHLPENEACVVMVNHQSFYDIPVVLLAVRGKMTFVAKKELFQVPVFGRAMQTAGIVKVDRKDHEKAVSSLQSAIAQLKRGRHIYIAPEGTRSPTGALQPFKSGGFRMALDAGVRILPVTVDGTRHVLPAKKLIVQTGHRVTVTISPPIDPKEYGLDKRKELMEAVRRAIAAPLGQ
ncbi:MAG: 1-acyl-sn-glycerol-3-phosphate acyltransferase [Polyangiaceae bacterium]|nr:1-acyl-sn-glycerol-3-phosphate acyltransferase [Polyangiaceae bacterium]